MFGFLRRISHLDAFPKIDPSHLRQTTPGGVATIVVFVVLGLLFFSELVQYAVPSLRYEFVVDPIVTSSFPIRLDISVASPCDDIVVQFIDPSGEAIVANKLLNARQIPFVAQGFRSADAGANSTKREARIETEGCRVSGSFPVNKVSGRIHITPLLHLRFSAAGNVDLNIDELNFSHRIHHMSFGNDYPSQKNPLDGSVEVAESSFHMFQYFVSVIPTLYHNTLGRVYHANQYAVNTYSRELDENKSGSLGIFFRYEMEPISVHITEDRQGLLEFIVRMVGILGGVYSCSGLLHHILTAVWTKVSPSSVAPPIYMPVK